MKLTGNKYVLRLMQKTAPAPGKYIWVKPPDNYRFFLETEKTDTVQAPTPHRKELVLMKLLIVAALVLLYFFIKWFFAGRTIGFYPLYLLLCISLGYKLVKLLFEWYHYWSINTPPRRQGKKQWTVDMLTTAMPGEPYEMIENTLRAMVKVRYPHTSYLCDEGNDPALKRLCNSLGVLHITRTLKVNAKAGNINNALQKATGDICVVLDPDHAPLPQFLDEVLPYFDNPETGFVQVAQVYKNAGDTWIAQGAAQQTYVFYGPMMMGMNSYGTAQAIGANCTFRRQALDSIGGHAAGLSEDMHTAMQLHARGWKSVYLPRIVTRGLVPANIGAYYKQQLKWSRGTFELLFTVFPVLFTRLSPRQRLHYFLLPFHFAAGIIALIDILIPVTVLFTGESPLYFNHNELWWLLLPLLSLTLLIRQYAQRWLLEKHERGFHLAGGILLFGTWWVYTIGFIYTLLRIKVPYIPTPKEDERSNNWKLHIPNIIVCGLCLTAVVYGLYNDWNPYNFVSAGFALLTVCMLGAVILASQQLFLLDIKSRIRKSGWLHRCLSVLQESKERSLSVSYRMLRKQAPLLAAAAIGGGALLFTPRISEDNNMSAIAETAVPKTTGGFYTGVYLPALQESGSLDELHAFAKATGAQPAIVSLYEAWGPASLDKFPRRLLDAIAAGGSIPMITWEPWVQQRKSMSAIAAGTLDSYIHAYAVQIRAYHKPVFIRFAHEPDNLAYPWSAAGGNTPEEYKAAWRKVVEIFAAEGAGNATWVWNPWSAVTMNAYYPGDAYVDWVGITCLNYGSASWNGQWHSFEALYHPFRPALLALHKPVMLAEFGSTNYGGDAAAWLDHALPAIHKKYTEIKSLVFFNSDKDKNWITAWRPSPATATIDWTIKQPGLLAQPLQEFEQAAITGASATANNAITHPSMLKGTPGAFTLQVNGRSFYIKGIVYNPGQDWRDGNHPLTIRQLEKDFSAMKQTGCNTIRRYQPSVYDRNILKTAQALDLKVIYGFWFDPTVDYYKDAAQVEKYLQVVREKVAQFHSSPAILAWCVGDQTGSALQNYYARPYLGLVQKAYIQMTERMAQIIHGLDTARPVITALEHSWQLPAALLAYRENAPSVDIIGINAAYEQTLGDVQPLMRTFDSSRPYLLTAFGPKGYWDSRYTPNTGQPEEDNDEQKANGYAAGWKEAIWKNKGYNLGGMAYCWRDRFDGSATWFGITDYKGRRKAAYYALQQVWTDAGIAGRSLGEGPGIVHRSEGGPHLFLAGPGFPLQPNVAYAFTAVYNGSRFKNPEWHLYREDGIDEINTLIPSDSINKTWVKLRSDRGKYRLYVYLDDGQGNTATASMPIVPDRGITNPGSNNAP